MAHRVIFNNMSVDVCPFVATVWKSLVCIVVVVYILRVWHRPCKPIYIQATSLHPRLRPGSKAFKSDHETRLGRSDIFLSNEYASPDKRQTEYLCCIRIGTNFPYILYDISQHTRYIQNEQHPFNMKKYLKNASKLSDSHLYMTKMKKFKVNYYAIEYIREMMRKHTLYTPCTKRKIKGTKVTEENHIFFLFFF
jgi:hypothetical protein